MNIRKATPDDAPVVADFNVRLAWETENLQLSADTVGRGVAAVLRDSGKGFYFVAELPEAGVVGQLMITYEWSDWRNGNIWWLQSVYVKQEFRSRGVFQALFAHVEQLARATKDVTALRLYMEKQNNRARRAYQKLGMTETEYVVFDKGMGGETEHRG